MFGKMLCKCGLHSWSEVQPGTVHLTSGDFPLIGVLWAQVGNQTCTRAGCTASRQVVREGEHGYDGLVIKGEWNYRILDRNIDTGWGYSTLDAKRVLAFERYGHSTALMRLGAPAAA